jgi:hypothetical protein
MLGIFLNPEDSGKCSSELSVDFQKATIEGILDNHRWGTLNPTSLYPQKLALTSPTGGSHSVGIVR